MHPLLSAQFYDYVQGVSEDIKRVLVQVGIKVALKLQYIACCHLFFSNRIALQSLKKVELCTVA